MIDILRYDCTDCDRLCVLSIKAKTYEREVELICPFGKKCHFSERWVDLKELNK